jgi:hypothetical protein
MLTTRPPKPSIPGEVAYLNYLGGLIINDARDTYKIKSRTAMARVAFKNKTTLFNTNWTEFKVKACAMVHLEHSYIWC